MKKELYLRLELTFSALKANKDINKLPLLYYSTSDTQISFLVPRYLLPSFHLSLVTHNHQVYSMSPNDLPVTVYILNTLLWTAYNRNVNRKETVQ